MAAEAIGELQTFGHSIAAFQKKCADQRPSGEPDATVKDKQNQPVFVQIELRHCLCIHRQADQNPTTTPKSSNGALQKIPVANL